MPDRRWVRIVEDGLVYSGPCLLHDIILFPDVAEDYADIYDGRDKGSGKKFCRVEADVDKTEHLHFGAGVPFDVGIYVDGTDAKVHTTIVFTPL